MIPKKLLPILLLLIYKSSFAFSSDFETIIAGAEFGDMMVFSGHGNLHLDYVRADSLSLKAQEEDSLFVSKLLDDEFAIFNNQEHINISVAFSNQKLRIEENSFPLHPEGGRFEVHWIWAYNGEKMDLLRLDGIGPNGLIIPKGSVRTENTIPVQRFDPRYHGLCIMGTPVGEFLKGALGTKRVVNIQVIGQEERDGIICDIIRGNIEGENEIITVWLAPSIMYRPVYIKFDSSDEMRVIHNSFIEYSEGIWFPEQITNEIYYFPNNIKTLYSREIITVNTFELNVELTDSLFEIEFPVGLMVYDFRTGEEFEVK